MATFPDGGENALPAQGLGELSILSYDQWLSSHHYWWSPSLLCTPVSSRGPSKLLHHLLYQLWYKRWILYDKEDHEENVLGEKRWSCLSNTEEEEEKHTLLTGGFRKRIDVESGSSFHGTTMIFSIMIFQLWWWCSSPSFLSHIHLYSLLFAIGRYCGNGSREYLQLSKTHELKTCIVLLWLNRNSFHLFLNISID